MNERPGFRLVTLPNGWAVGRFAALEDLGIVHAVTTRQGPDVMMVRHEHEETAASLAAALDLEGVAWLDQVHGNDVVTVASDGFAGRGDGMISNRPRLGLAGRSGDCPLILIADPATGAVGVAHSSWRGTVKHMPETIVTRLAEEFRARPEDMIACICPSAGPCCYEVGQDVVDAVIKNIGPHATDFFQHRDGRTYFDLWYGNADQLRRAGVRPQNTHVACVCSICQNKLFPSHRREGDKAGRFVAVIAGT